MAIATGMEMPKLALRLPEVPVLPLQAPGPAGMRNDLLWNFVIQLGYLVYLN